MCGRYAAKWEPAEFENVFGVQPPLFESYNVAPTQYAPVVLRRGEREVVFARWGLVPRWVDKPLDFRANLCNARAETLSEKASFKRPFKSQRCLVPASGFYEWRKVGAAKRPFYIRLEGAAPLAFAGFYDHWQKDDQSLYSYTVITTSPNAVMQNIHDRMPVVLAPEHFGTWLGEDGEPGDLEALLRPYEGDLEAYEVDKRVGKVGENDEHLLEPVT